MADLLCRICLEENELIVHMSERSEEFDADLCTLLQTCGGLTIYNDDPLPKYLCQECTNELLITAKFRKKCAKAQQRLDQIKTNTDEFMLIKANEATDAENVVAEDTEAMQQIVEETNDGEDLTEFNCDDTLGQNVTVAAFEELTAPYEIHATNMEEPEVTVANEEISTDCQQNELQIAYDSIIYTSCEPEEQTILTQSSIVEETATLENDTASTCMTNELSTLTNEILSDAVSEDTAMNAIINSMGFEHVTKYICDICGAVFMHAYTLQRHLHNFHKVETILSCDQCKSCFSSNTNFDRHTCNTTEVTKLATRQEAKIGVPSCTHCGKKFPNRFALEMHIRTHTGERPFACSSCPSTFKTKSALETHKKLHEGRVDYKCTYCHKAFADGGNLKRHLLIHTGERPHVCNICKKSFARVFMLQLHLRTHTGEKPYVCPVCQRGFTQLASLRSHNLTVHNGGTQIFKCSVCQVSFPRRSQLRNHVKTKHANLVLSNEETVAMIEQDDAVNYIVEEEVATEIVTTSDGDLDCLIAETL